MTGCLPPIRAVAHGFFSANQLQLSNCAGFSNEVEKYGIKPSAIAALENGNKGCRLSMNSDSGSEYEVEVRGGHAKLGLVRFHRKCCNFAATL